MDSKEEILSKFVYSKMEGFSSEVKFVSMMHFPTKSVYEAMDEYAKQVVIDFGKYLDAIGYNFERWSFNPLMFDEYLQSKQ